MPTRPFPRIRSHDGGAGRAPVPAGGDRDELALVAAIRAGDVTAFEALFHAYHGPLWGYALSFLRSPELAEECAQDVLFRVWAQRNTWIVRDSVRGYLYAAVRNHAINALKAQRVAGRWTQRAIAFTTPNGMGQGPQSAEDDLRSRELERALAAAVARLPARRQEAFTLRWQHGLTNTQIAQVMGVSVKAVEGHLAAALKTLRGMLGPLLL